MNASKTKPKRCRDCIYFLPKDNYGKTDRCMHTEALVWDTIGDKHFFYAAQMRSDINKCGPEAFFFKSKPQIAMAAFIFVGIVFGIIPYLLHVFHVIK